MLCGLLFLPGQGIIHRVFHRYPIIFLTLSLIQMLPYGNMRDMKESESGVKSRSGTEELLLAAVSDIVEERGFAGLGVNAVAERAGVSKVLIYRYFDGYEGLLREWALRRSFWIDGTRNLEERFASAAENGERRSARITALAKELFVGQWRSLRSNRVDRELLRWFVASDNPVAAEVMDRIEKRGTEVSGLFRRVIDSSDDLEAMTAVLVAGICYLAVISDRVSAFNGVPLDTAEGEERIRRVIESMVGRLFTNGRD